MKRPVVFLLLCLLGLLTSPLHADVELSFDFFHEELSPMGEWAEVDGYGYVWHPSGVDADWAPYTDGYWTYTDAGWTWVSYEDWGGICYHYGRWVDLADYGWCWVPGYDWGPAWVSWRNNDDYVGWAPLPPECDWEQDRGISVWVDAHYEIGPRYYSFCRVRDFGAPVLRHVLLPRIRNVEICFGTVNITNITFNRDYGCAFNGGIDYDFIRARCERPVPALKLVRNTTNIYIQGNRGNVIVNAPRGNALIVAAPKVTQRVNFRTPTRKVEVRRKFDRNAVTRGWVGLDKPETRDRLLGKMREETKGLSRENSPAHPPRREALAVVPKEADLKARPASLRRLPAERRNGEVAVQDEPNEKKGREAAGVRRPDRGGEVNVRPGGPRAETADRNEPQAPGRANGREKKEGAEAIAEQPSGLRKRRDGGEGQPNVPAGVDQPGNDVERAARQERAGNGQRSAEMRREAAQENAQREKAQREAAQENAQREKVQRERAQEAAGARKAQAETERDQNRAAAVEQQRREAMAERQAEARKEAAAENARRQAAERQNDNQRRMIQERQAEAQRDRAESMQRQQQQQAEARARASEASRERAVQAQRQQAAEANRARAMENQQRAAAQAQAQQRAQMQAQAQQRAQAAQAARPQPEGRQQNGEERGNRKDKRDR